MWHSDRTLAEHAQGTGFHLQHDLKKPLCWGQGRKAPGSSGHISVVVTSSLTSLAAEADGSRVACQTLPVPPQNPSPHWTWRQSPHRSPRRSHNQGVPRELLPCAVAACAPRAWRPASAVVRPHPMKKNWGSFPLLYIKVSRRRSISQGSLEGQNPHNNRRSQRGCIRLASMVTVEWPSNGHLHAREAGHPLVAQSMSWRHQ